MEPLAMLKPGTERSEAAEEAAFGARPMRGGGRPWGREDLAIPPPRIFGLGPWGGTRAKTVARFEEITKMGAF